METEDAIYLKKIIHLKKIMELSIFCWVLYQQGKLLRASWMFIATCSVLNAYTTCMCEGVNTYMASLDQQEMGTDEHMLPHFTT